MSDNNEEKFFNLLYANVDEDLNDIISTNAGKYKISIFMTRKYSFNNSNFTEKGRDFHLKYNEDVINLYLEDNLNSIGLAGYIDVKNESSYLDIPLGKHNNYYIVVNITQYNNDDKPIIKYEPYIFDISYVKNLSSPETEKKILRLGLVDCITSVLKEHSIASVIKKFNNISQEKSYKIVFGNILQYVRDFLRISTNDKYGFYKELVYDEKTKLGNGVYNGNDENTDMSELVSQSFSKLDNNASIYDAMQQLLKDCCTSMKSPAAFKNKYTSIGDVLIPFFFKEEYTDVCGFYNSLWGSESESAYKSATKRVASDGSFLDKVQSTLKDKADELRKNSGENSYKKFIRDSFTTNNTSLMLRPITMRDIFMPFYITFGSNSYMGVYENINPYIDDESNKKIVTLNGTYSQEISSIQFNPIDMNLVRKIWKNVIFVDTNGEGGSLGTSTLIFFSWFIDYYLKVFLRTNADDRSFRVTNVQPSFHMMQVGDKIPHATKEGNSFSNDYDEYNSYVFYTETPDSVKECLRLMGKNIASFALVGDSYQFKIRGNLLRRPNEIIKCGHRGTGGSTQQGLTMGTGLSGENYTLMYVKKIVHHFHGTNYENDVLGCKICEILHRTT